MQIAFWHSIRVGGSPLMAGLQRGLEALGHNVVTAHHQGRYDLVVMFNQIAHDASYQYPDFPAPNPIVFIDAAEYGYFRRLPGVACDYLNAFSPGSVNHDTKNVHQQAKLRAFLEGKSFPYFLREKFKFFEWPAMYSPIDYPLYKFSEEPTPPNREQYLSRQSPFFLSWGLSHPWRKNLTDALRAAGFPVAVIEEVTEQGITPRMPQTEYFPKMLGAKAGASYDGYGSGSFRVTEILVRSLLLMGPLTIDTREPLIDGESAVFYDVDSEGEEFIGTNIVEKLQRALDDPEGSYDIYERGWHHCWNHYSEIATARYVLKTVENHDYGIPTVLDLA